MAEAGAGLLLLALAAMAASAAAGFVAGWRQDPRLARAARTAFGAGTLAVAVASGVLLTALLTHDFAIAYVTEHTDRSLPWPLLAAAFYGGQEGSLLYWTLALSVIGAVSLAGVAPGLGVRLPAYANGLLAALAGFFLIVLTFVASPFDLLVSRPPDGLGLNPVLRDGGMLIHPPFLLAGYSSFAVPFAFAMAALLAGGRSPGAQAAWMAHTRRFALLAWALQGAGLVLGMWWAYHVLGWGGYWGWDPVEDVALMPWLVTTAYLHTSLAAERRRPAQAGGDGPQVAGYGLVIASFLLSIFGTFIVRSGVVPSVHSFAVSPLGPWFFGLVAAGLLFTMAVWGWRLRPGAITSGPAPPSAALTVAGAFRLQSALLGALTAVVLWGVTLPLLSGMLGRELVVGAAYYQRVTAPLLALLLALLAVGPLLPWRRTGGLGGRRLRRLRWPVAGAALTLAGLLALGARQPGPLLTLPLVGAGLATCLAEYAGGVRRARRMDGSWPLTALRLVARRRRRYGAFAAHAGFLILAAGVAGSHFWQQDRQVELRPGQSVVVAGHRLTYEGSREQPAGDHSELVARLRMGGDTLAPARLSYPGLGGQAVSRVAIRSSPLDDVYVVLVGTSGGATAFHVFVNPLVTWIWAGAALLVGGALLGHWRPLPSLRRTASPREGEGGVGGTSPPAIRLRGAPEVAAPPERRPQGALR